jgi:hypothetical protein
MHRKEFVSYVASLVSKVARDKIEDIDPEFNVLSYYDEGMDLDDQVTCANLAATEVLSENGYINMG